MKLSNKIIALFIATTLGIISVAAINKASVSWSIDKSHSSIKFEVRHFFSNVPGAFHDYKADVNFSPDNLAESSINVTIQVSSIDTDHERRDNHLRNSDFFDVEKWPTMTFTSSEIVSIGDNNFIARGELTIKNISADFELPFTLLGVMDHPRKENSKLAGIISEFQLLRNDFGVGKGKYLSDIVIGNEINVTLNLELNAKISES